LILLYIFLKQHPPPPTHTHPKKKNLPSPFFPNGKEGWRKKRKRRGKMYKGTYACDTELIQYVVLKVNKLPSPRYSEMSLRR
jgi:hypothetical protein